MYEAELEIINDPIFQRLRRVKQLSFAYTAYHGAEHSRFGHVLGAMHTVDRALQKIKKNCDILKIPIDLTEEDFKLARLAALLHDVGHKPFSHALDGIIPEQHEDYSVAIVEKRFASTIEKAGIRVKDVTNMIKGKPPFNKPFLASLINSQLDVDKFDYLSRDSHYAGVKYGIFDLERVLDSLCVVDGGLVVLDGGYFAAEQMIVARYYMFEQLYFHHTKRAFEGMARKVAQDLIDNHKLDYPTTKELEDIKRMEEFARYDDAWFLEQMQKKAKNQMKQIVDLINKRIPFKTVVDSEDIRRKMLTLNEKDQPESKGFIQAIEADIQYNLKSLRMNESDIIFDAFKNVPYKLRPYTRVGEGGSEGADIVFIYNERVGSKEPIERRSVVVQTLATANLSARRIYVNKQKFNTLHGFLKEKYSAYFQ